MEKVLLIIGDATYVEPFSKLHLSQRLLDVQYCNFNFRFSNIAWRPSNLTSAFVAYCMFQGTDDLERSWEGFLSPVSNLALTVSLPFNALSRKQKWRNTHLKNVCTLLEYKQFRTCEFTVQCACTIVGLTLRVAEQNKLRRD